MVLAFESKNIRQICEDEDKAKSNYGSTVAKALLSRLADLVSATSVEDLLVGNPGEVPCDCKHPCYKVELSSNHVLIFCANHVDMSYVEENKINWSKVTRIKILKIEIKDDNNE